MGLRILGRMELFRDRLSAGQLLAEALKGLARARPLVLGIPRGGVVVAAPVARELGGDLDVVIARKLGAPGNPELAVGAVVEGGETHINRSVALSLSVGDEYLEEERARQLRLIEQRAARYRAMRPLIPRGGRDVIVVDDGVATGATMIATLQGLRAARPASLGIALPVGPEETLEALARVADEVVVLSAPYHFQAVGQFYEIFDQVEDAEVADLLRNAQPAGTEWGGREPS